LFGGKLWCASRLDPVMDIVGAGVVDIWAYGLMRDSGRVLLDAEMNAPVVAEIREVINTGDIKATISDLHVWRVGKGEVRLHPQPDDRDRRAARLFPAPTDHPRRARSRDGGGESVRRSGVIACQGAVFDASCISVGRHVHRAGGLCLFSTC